MDTAGQNPDRIRPKHGRTGQNPDRIRTESGQNATMLNVIARFSKECQGAFFSQFFRCQPRPLVELDVPSRGIKTPKN